MIFFSIAFFSLVLALALSCLVSLLVILFISIKTKQPYSLVFKSISFFSNTAFLAFFLSVPIVVIFALNTKTVNSYSIIDNSSCLCSSTTFFFGEDIDSESKICSYIQLDGVYYLIHEDNSLSLIEIDSYIKK